MNHLITSHLSLRFNNSARLTASSKSALRCGRSSSAWCAAALLILLLLAQTANAQTVEHTSNLPDQALRSAARVDPSTLGMGLQVPLGGLQGRAGTGLPISLSYSSKVWRIEYIMGYQGYLTYRTWTGARYAENSAAGWTTSLAVPRIEFTGEGQFYNSLGEPLGEDVEGGDPYQERFYISRAHIHLPDGSSHELRKDETVRIFNNTNYDFSGTLSAVDGSQVRYETATNTLFLPDGSRYVLGDPTGWNEKQGYSSPPTYYIDRHGNTLTYNHTSRQWTDTLGRVIGMPLPVTPVKEDRPYTVPGVNGQAVTYTFRWRYLRDPVTNETVLTDTAQPLHYRGNFTCAQTSQAASPSLFYADSVDRICAEALFNPVVLSEIVLPTGQSYRFTYNVHGEIDRVYYPTGGYERFRYAKIAPLSHVVSPYDESNRGVVEHWVSAGGGAAESRWEYGVNTASPYTAYSVAPDGTRSERTLYGSNFNGPGNSPPFGFEDVRVGMSYDERGYSPSGQMLRRSLTELATTTVTAYSEGGYQMGSATRYPRAIKGVSLLLDTGGDALASTTTMTHDGDMNVISTSKYDFTSVTSSTAQTGAIGSIPSGTLVRTDETTYLVNDTSISSEVRQGYRDRNLTGLPASSRVKNAAGGIVAQSEIKYDEAAYPLFTYGGVTGWNDPGTSVRANATTTRSWLDTAGAWLETHAQYDQTGNMRKAWDARGNVSEVEYSAAYHYAYPTHTLSAVPDPTNARATNTPLESWTAYDFSTGKVTSTTDANSKTTILKYVDDENGNAPDALDRLRKVEQPDGGWTRYWYGRNASGDYVRSRTSINATQTTDDFQFFDGLGRSVRSFGFDGSQWITTDTQYDALGRVWRVSNPYLSAGDNTPVNPSGNWTTTAYDALGRVATVTTPDSAQVTTAYSGNAVTVTDQAGKSRRSLTDGLGRLSQVVEDPAGLAYQTTYAYDVLGNLRRVEQGGQFRYFMYDSLSRLVRAKNPEQAVNANLTTAADPVSGNTQWAVAYAYDNNGNLSSKTDARGVTASYQYDNINRVKQTNYSDGTPYTLNTWDFAANGRGRFYADYESSTTGTINYVLTYDEMGRAKSGKTEFYVAGTGWVPAYTTSRNYDLMGHVTSQAYPSGRVVNYTQFDVAGRLKVMTGNLGDGATRTYTTGVNRATGAEEGIQYDEASRMVEERFGTQTPLYHKRHYNVRGQLYDVRLSTVAWVNDQWNWNRGCLAFYYGSAAWGQSGADNNGNLSFQQNWVPDNDQISSYTYFQDNYAYDALNRLSGMEEYRSGAGFQFGQWFTYDRFGNRQISEAATTPGINRAQFTVDTQTNRLGVPAGYGGVMSYDSAGNLTYDSHSPNTLAGSRTFDAENRMTATYYTTNQFASGYTYDAAGKRVRRKILGSEVWQVYGLEGELLAEYAANAAPSSPQKEYGYRNGELLVTANGKVNVAAATNGATASASSTHSCCGFSAAGVINGNNRGPWANGEGWNDATPDAFPDWLQVDFAGSRTIDEISVFTLHDDVNNPNNPTEAQTFTLYGLRDFDVQYWNGSAWVTVTGGTVTGNNKVWRKFTFSPVTASKIRVVMNYALDTWSRVVEVEAWGPAAGGSAGVVQWLVPDHLGTPRMIADQTGSLAGVKRHDYLPFGEELYAGTGGRTAGQGYVGNADGNRKRWAQLERDDETGLDFAEARYYSSTQGRFTSVDPLSSSGKLAMPQSLNRYAYVLNNPLALIDPSGLMACPPNKKCTKDEKGNEWYEDDGEDILVGPEGKAKKDPPPANPIAPAIVLPVTITIQTSLRLPPFLIGTGIVGIGWGLGDAIANPRSAPYRHRDGGLSTTAGTQAYPINLNLPPLFTTPTTLPAPPDPLLAKKSKESGADRATDIPSWAKGEQPEPGESGKDFAERVFAKYGKAVTNRGPGSEFNKIKKYGDRAFPKKK